MKNIFLISTTALLAIAISGCAAPDAPSNATTSATDNISNPCIVTAPEQASFETEKNKNAEAALTLFGKDILKSGVSSQTKDQLNIIYQKIPDSLVACQMILQLGACMVKEKQQIGKEFLQVVEKNSTCTSKIEQTTATPGTKVYIQVADASQVQLGTAIQISLGDLGFLSPGVENMKGKSMPSLNEVRYFYQSQFNDAKLVKRALAERGVKDIMLKPLYALPTKPPLQKAFLEVWLTNP